MTIKTRKVDIELNGKFIKKDFEIPEDWSDRAALICASKYATDNENSALDIIDRVVNQITEWGKEQGYFKGNTGYNDQENILPETFANKLRDILINQRAAFNSPVWFNCGTDSNSNQVSACFILSVEDTMEGILNHYITEGMIFKGGSGAGINISKLRAKGEKLSNKGESSGTVSFMRGWDKSAGTIRSGGKVRRASKLVCMDVDHPDIMEFIECKRIEEKKAKILIENGISPEEAYSTVDFQNTNHSIRVSDEFIKACKEDNNWSLINRGDGKIAKTLKARDILKAAALNAWHTGDPGIQFDNRMNQDNPVPSLGKIESTNPCQPGWATVLTPEGIRTFNDIAVGSTIWSGYKWTKIIRKKYTGVKKVYAYYTERGTFYGTKDHKVFCHGERVRVADASSINISPCIPENLEPDNRSFPILYSEFFSEEPVYDITVEAEEHSYWTGGLLVSNCSEFSAINNSSCNLASLNLVKYLYLDNDNELFLWGQFDIDIRILITAMDILVEAADYPTQEVRDVTIATRPLGLGFTNLGAYLMIKGIPYNSKEAREKAAEITRFMTASAYRQSIELAKRLGSFSEFRNNVDVCANIAARLTGTDDTDSIWQDIKEYGLRNSQLTLLAPTGTVSFLMDCDTTGIEPLFALKATKTLVGGGTIEIIPNCVKEAIAKRTKEQSEFDTTNDSVFATANEIHWKDHIMMMSACQEYLNGAISKTINMPSDCTVEDIYDAYMYGWENGLKALAVYRDGSKSWQPLTDNNKKKNDILLAPEVKNKPVRTKLPDDAIGHRHKFNIQGFKGYIMPHEYDNGSLGELFLVASKQGSTTQGLLDGFATMVSLALQYGVPLEKLIDKFKTTKFDPAGITTNQKIPMCTSIFDYVFRYLEEKYIIKETTEQEKKQIPQQIEKQSLDGPLCTNCGSLTVRAGSCFCCTSCGETSGCS